MDFDYADLDDVGGSTQAAKVQDLGEGPGSLSVPSQAPEPEQKECEPLVSVSADGVLRDDDNSDRDDGVSLSIADGTVHYTDEEEAAAEEVL